MDQDPAFFRITEYSGYDTMTKRPALIFSTWKHLHQNSILQQSQKYRKHWNCWHALCKPLCPQDLLRKTFRFLDSAKDSSENMNCPTISQFASYQYGWGNCVAQWFITNITILTAWFLFVSSKDMLEKLASHVESNMGLLPQNHSPSGPHDAGPSHCGCCVFWQRKSWGSSSSHAADYSVVAPTLADAGGFRTSKLRTQKKLAFRLEFPYTFSQFVWFCHATNQQPLLVLVFSVRSQAN